MYCVGAKVEEYYPVSIPSHGGILNMTVVSYMDRMEFGLIACRETLPDIDVLTKYLVDEFAALQKAVHGRRQRAA
jgi:hypothetical protein